MPAGDSFTPSQLEWIKRAVRNAETISGLTFSVFIGVSEEDSRAYAERLHKALTDPDHSVLVMCDVEFRRLEIVTGIEARRALAALRSTPPGPGFDQDIAVIRAFNIRQEEARGVGPANQEAFDAAVKAILKDAPQCDRTSRSPSADGSNGKRTRRDT